MNASTLNIRIDVDDKGSVQIRKLGADLQATGEKGKAAASAMDGAFSQLKNTLGGIALVALGKQIFNVMDQYTQLESRLKLVTTGTENLAAVQQKLYETSLRTHVANAETVKLYTSIARATQDLGVTQAQALQMTETINQALIISGASAASSEAALIQLGQGLSSGVLRGEEFNSVMEQTPRLARALADGLGVNIGQLREMAKEGQLTSAVVTQALLSQKEAIESEFGQMKQTISQAWTDLTTVVQTFIHEADKSGDSTGAMVASIKDLSSTIEGNKGAILSLFSGITLLTAGAIEGISGIVRSVQGLAIVAASPDKSLGDWMMASREDMKAWQTEVGNGTAFIKDRLAELAAKKDEVNRTFVFTDAAKQAQLEESAAIDRQTAALRLQIEVINGKAAALAVAKDSFMVLAQLEQEDARTKGLKSKAQQDPFMVNNQWAIDNAEALTKAEDKFYTEKEKREQKASEESIKANEKRAAEIARIDQQLTDAIIKNSDSRYAASVADLKKETAALEASVGQNEGMIARIHEYEKAKMIELGEFKNMYSTQEQDRIKKITDSWQVNEETKFQLSKEQYEKQMSLTAEMDAYFEKSEDNKLAVEMARLAKSYDAKMRAAEGDMDLQDRVKDWYVRQQKEIEDKHNRSLQKMKQAWENFGHDVENNFTSVITSGLKGEFDSIGDAWKALTDKMLESFLDLVAKMIVAWAEAEIISWWTGNESTFSFSAAGGKSNGNSSSAGGTVGGLATSAVTAGAKDYIWTNGVKPAATAAYDAGTAYLFGSGSAGATGAAATSGGSIASGTATPAILDAYATYGTTTATAAASSAAAAEASAATSVATFEAVEAAAATSSAAAGTGTGAAAGAGTAAGMSGAAVGGIMAIIAAFALTMTFRERASTADLLNATGMGPGGLADKTGVQGNGRLQASTEGFAAIDPQFKQFNQISIDTAANLMVLGSEIREVGERGNETTTGMSYMVESFNASTGTWENTKINFDSMISQMAELAPTTTEAIDATAAYVAQMAGVPAVADELAFAYAQAQLGTDAFSQSVALAGGSFVNAAGMVISAADMMNGISIGINMSGYVDEQWAAEGHNFANNPDAISTPATDASYFELNGRASGGIVNRLLVPNGDDGFGALKLGEGVIDADTMTILSKSIRNGSFQGGNNGELVAVMTELRNDIRVLMSQVGTSTARTASVLRKWDAIGMPGAAA
jgi:tape measure domain-containing protein